MTELVIMHDQQAVTTSLQVAEDFGKEHNHVLRDISLLKSDNPELDSENYFAEGTYTNSRGREYRMYYMNRDGFTLLAMGFTGNKALQFKLKYIEAFNKMEKQLSTPQNSLELALKAALEHERSIKEIKSDVDYLKGNMRIDSLQQQDIQQAAKQSVVHALGGMDSIAYQEISKKAFSAFWREFKQHFKVPRYGDIPKVKHDEALRFIQLWRPSTSLQMEIDSTNSQMSFQ